MKTQTPERVQESIFGWGNFSIKTTVINGTVNQSEKYKGDRKDALYINSYTSTNKYNSDMNLTSINYTPTRYVAVSFGKTDENGKYMSGEVYLSNSRLADFVSAVEKVYEDIATKPENYFKGSKLTKTGENYEVTIENIVPNASIYIQLDVLEDSNGNLQHGVIIALEDGRNSNNTEEFYQAIPFSVFEDMVSLLSNYDFLTATTLTAIMGMIAYANNGTGSKESTLKQSGGSSFSRRKPLESRRKTRFNLSSTDDDDEEDTDGYDSEEDDDEEEEAPVMPKRRGAATKKATPVKKAKKSSTSIDDMISKGEEFTLEDDEDDDEVF